ncbi:MAG: DUF7718 family protein [Thermomicrobiales bacterium]
MGSPKRTRQYARTLGISGDAVRVRLTTIRGRVTAFTVQYEGLIEEKWMPVVRYDTVHGRPHRDTLDWHGRVVDKEWLTVDIDLNTAATLAERDIISNWQTYRAGFMQRRPASWRER